jgi:hypothetical protein
MRKTDLSGDRYRGEKNLTEALAAWTSLSGGAFPGTIQDLTDSTKVVPLLRAAYDRAGDPHQELEKALQEGQKLLYGLCFAQEQMVNGDWRHAGAGAKLGEATKAICWGKPEKSPTYRVVYGDLKIKDLSPSDVEKLR